MHEELDIAECDTLDAALGLMDVDEREMALRELHADGFWDLVRPDGGGKQVAPSVV